MFICIGNEKAYWLTGPGYAKRVETLEIFMRRKGLTLSSIDALTCAMEDGFESVDWNDINDLDELVAYSLISKSGGLTVPGTTLAETMSIRNYPLGEDTRLPFAPFLHRQMVGELKSAIKNQDFYYLSILVDEAHVLPEEIATTAVSIYMQYAENGLTLLEAWNKDHTDVLVESKLVDVDGDYVEPSKKFLTWLGMNVSTTTTTVVEEPTEHQDIGSVPSETVEVSYEGQAKGLVDIFKHLPTVIAVIDDNNPYRAAVTIAKAAGVHVCMHDLINNVERNLREDGSMLSFHQSTRRIRLHSLTNTADASELGHIDDYVTTHRK